MAEAAAAQPAAAASPEVTDGKDKEKAMDDGLDWRTFVHMFFDALAVLARTLVAILSGMKWVLKRVVYPCKEWFFWFIDILVNWYSPHRKRHGQRPGADVPSFTPDFQF